MTSEFLLIGGKWCSRYNTNIYKEMSIGLAHLDIEREDLDIDWVGISIALA